MAFPTSITTFTNPVSTDYLNSPAHATQHSTSNTDVTAIETKMGIGASACSAATDNKVLTADGAGNSAWEAVPTGTKITVKRQDNTTNTTPTCTIQIGWGFIGGDASNNITEAVTFPTAFTDVPIVVINPPGYKASSDPATLDEMTGLFGEVTAKAQAIATTGFTAVLYTTAGTFASGTRYGYTWMAIGQTA